MICVFLDDERNPEDVYWVAYPAVDIWCIVRDYQSFTDKIKQLMDSDVEFIVSFDHDIQDFSTGVELTGYDCLKALVEYCIDTQKLLPQAFFHTQNPIGRDNMIHYYKNAVKFLLYKRG